MSTLVNGETGESPSPSYLMVKSLLKERRALGIDFLSLPILTDGLVTKGSFYDGKEGTVLHQSVGNPCACGI